MKDLPSILFTDVLVEAAPVEFRRWDHDVIMGWKKDTDVKLKITEEIHKLQAVADLAGRTEDGHLALMGVANQTQFSRRYLGLSKCEPVAAIIKEELANHAYPKIVLFAVHRDVVMFLRELLVDFYPLVIFGGTPVMKRQQAERKFQNDKRYRVLIGNVQAAGVAITLTAAHEVGFVEASWVPSENAQAAMRVHRIGQQNPVRVRFFNLADSVDDQIQKVCRRKTKDLVSVFDTPASTIINPLD